VRFGPWLPLERAAALAPPAPGLLQTRAADLLAFPRGKSAMVLYAAAPPGQTLAGFLGTEAGAALLAAAGRRGACFVRYALAERAGDQLARLLADFERRFGARPPGNAGDTDGEGHDPDELS
jgi:hypothetical protein